MARRNPKPYTPSRGVFGKVTFRSKYQYEQALRLRKENQEQLQERISSRINVPQASSVATPQPRRFQFFTNARLQTSHYQVRNNREFDRLINFLGGKIAQRRRMYQARIKDHLGWHSGYKMAYLDDVRRDLNRMLNKYGVSEADLEDLEVVEIEEA